MNDNVIPTEGEISRKHRIILGGYCYGLYGLGMATTDAARTDEDCAMDNLRVPWRYEDLTDEYREKLRVVMAHDAEMEQAWKNGEATPATLPAQHPIDISGWTVKAEEPTLKLFVYVTSYACEFHAAVLTVTKEQALALINAAKVKRFNEDWAAREKEFRARTPVPPYQAPLYIPARDDVKLEEINEVLAGVVQHFDSGYD